MGSADRPPVRTRRRRVGPWWLWLPILLALSLSIGAWVSSAPTGATAASGGAPSVAVTAVPATTPPRSPWSSVTGAGGSAHLGKWTLRDRFLVLAALADQGLATVHRPRRPTTIVFRGALSIPPDLRHLGWTHVGDPGGWHGYLFDAYQASPASALSAAKMFQVTTPSGAVHRFVHALDPGEMPNNSFAAVTPDGRWLVSGEWGRMERLLEFPTPLVNHEISTRQTDLPLVASVGLDHPVRNVQGCTFVTAVRMLCATDDPGTDLWPTSYQLLQVDLPRPLDGQPETGTVTSLGELPLLSGCPGTYEVEGIDFDTSSGTLRVEVRPPGRCGLSIAIYDYTRRAS